MINHRCKKIVATIVLGAFVCGVPTTAFAGSAESFANQMEFVICDEIQVSKHDNVSEGDWAYQKASEIATVDLREVSSMTAVFDNESGLYKVESEENLYLLPVSDKAFQPMERCAIIDTGDLREVKAQYNLTETEAEDIVAFMGQCPGEQIIVYAPRASEQTGRYNGKQCRLVQVNAYDDQSGYEIEIGKELPLQSLGYHTIVYAISILGTKANMGIALTHAALNLLGIDFTHRSDSSSYARKQEKVTFQYLDFYELGSAYITRGKSSYGSITITTHTTCWVKQPNGDFVNEARSGMPVSGSFGTVQSLSSLAAKCYIYFEDYSGVGLPWYADYIVNFKIDKFNSIPAIEPKRYVSKFYRRGIST